MGCTRYVSTGTGVSRPAQRMGEARYILAVDDDVLYVEALASLVERFGYRVVYAGSLREARERLGEFHYRLILLAVLLPDGPGARLQQEIRASCPDAAVMFLTPYLGAPGPADNALQDDTIELLSKTRSPAYVMGRVQHYLCA